MKQPINWFPLLVVIVPSLAGLSFWLRDWSLAAIAAIMSVYLVLEARSLLQAKKAAQKESKASTQKGTKV